MQSLANYYKTLQRLVLIGLCCLAVAACSSFRFPGVFRIDIGQGNIITAEMIEKLKIGMTKRQVEYVMGSAMIRDPFSTNRWDYVYNYESGKGAFVENQLTLFFEGDRLQRIDDSRFKDPEKLREELQQKMIEERS